MLLMAIKDGKAHLRIELALRRLDRYEAMAKPQNERIWEAHRLAEEPLENAGTYEDRKRHLWWERSWIEAHFYFICWDAIGKAIDVLRNKKNGLRSPTLVWKTHRYELEMYREARDHLEHWTERLPGEKNDKWGSVTSGGSTTLSGNMGHVRLEKTFTFRDREGNDKEIPIGPETAELLLAICKRLKEELALELSEILVKQQSQGT